MRIYRFIKNAYSPYKAHRNGYNLYIITEIINFFPQVSWFPNFKILLWKWGEHLIYIIYSICQRKSAYFILRSDFLSKEDYFTMKGKVVEKYKGGTFGVEIETGQTVTCHLSGRIRSNNIKILLDDKVDVEISVYDLTKGRIIYRYR